MVSNVYFCLANDGTPFLGGIFETENDAVDTVRKYISLARVKQSLPSSLDDEDISLEFIRQLDMRFKLIVNFGQNVGCIEELANIDELMLRKFKRSLSEKSYFVLTCFFKEGDNLVSTLTNNNLGLIIYKV